MSRTKNRDGFTVIEVIIAIVILSIGLLGLTATAASVTRMVAQGQRYNRASALANERFERVRALRCTAMTAGSSTQGNYTIAWTVTSVSGGRGREIGVSVTSPTGRGTRTDNFTTTVPC